MNRAASLVYPNNEHQIPVVFDIRIPGVVERFHRERWAWQERADVEALDESHYVMIIRPGGAEELAA